MVLSVFFFFKQKTAYEMRISDWSSDVCSSDLGVGHRAALSQVGPHRCGVGHVVGVEDVEVGGPVLDVGAGVGGGHRVSSKARRRISSGGRATAGCDTNPKLSLHGTRGRLRLAQVAPEGSAMPDEGRRTAHGPWGSTALVGVGETDYVRGSELHVCDLILDASMAAITEAGLTPADIDGIIPRRGS